MPNGDDPSDADPRYAERDFLGSYLLGLLAGAYTRAETARDGEILETDLFYDHMMIRGKHGNYRIELKITF